MVTVKVSELKNRLSFFLRAVRAGNTVLVCDRDRVIARIEAAGASMPIESDQELWIGQLERRGTVRRARRKLPANWRRSRPAVRADVVRALLEERENGR